MAGLPLHLPFVHKTNDYLKWIVYKSILKRANVHQFKGCGLGPWLVLVSPCFRENVVATCKIGSFCVV